MQVGVSSYSFFRYLSEKSMDIFDVIKTAAEIGFEGIEFTDFGPKEADSNKIEVAGKVKDFCAKSGIAIMSYTIGADFLKPRNGGDWNDEVSRLRGELDIAKALGAPLMRHDVTTGFTLENISLKDYFSVLPALTQGCRAVTEYAQSLGIKTMFENHGYFIQDSERCAMLLDEINHPNIGSLVDMGNFLCADEDPVHGVTKMAPRALHVHAKDFHIKPSTAIEPGTGWIKSRGGNWLRGAIFGHGNVDALRCLKAIKAAGYDGFVSLEFEGLEDNKEALTIGIENLKKYIQLID